MFGLLTGMASSSTQPLGSAKKLVPDSMSIPICAPEAGSALPVMKGHSTGA